MSAEATTWETLPEEDKDRILQWHEDVKDATKILKRDMKMLEKLRPFALEPAESQAILTARQNVYNTVWNNVMERQTETGKTYFAARFWLMSLKGTTAQVNGITAPVELVESMEKEQMNLYKSMVALMQRLPAYQELSTAQTPFTNFPFPDSMDQYNILSEESGRSSWFKATWETPMIKMRQQLGL